MSWDDREDEMTVPCPMCFEVYECSPDCDEIARAWIEEDEAKESNNE